MRANRDPEGAELRYIIANCQLLGKNVLEIGCGHGQLTFQYAGSPQHSIGIDPDLDELRDADRENRNSNTFFVQAKAEHMPFSSQAFEVVIFASSL